MTLSRVVRQLAASRPARWLLLAAAVTELLYGVSSWPPGWWLAAHT